MPSNRTKLIENPRFQEKISTILGDSSHVENGELTKKIETDIKRTDDVFQKPAQEGKFGTIVSIAISLSIIALVFLYWFRPHRLDALMQAIIEVVRAILSGGESCDIINMSSTLSASNNESAADTIWATTQQFAGNMVFHFGTPQPVLELASY
mmetsp:Transcript_45239/g.51996  ORF Transcript_45239/g.51996 Transcript_45239/m.51996 type:complete len:153 (-) Transcript_45239:1389-1847(-)